MAQYEAGTITTNGVDVPVKVDDDGNWRAEYAGKFLSADTREKLKGQLSRLTKQTRASVEVHVIRIKENESWANPGIVITRGVLTGLHSGTGNVLSKWDVRGKQVSEQITGWGGPRTIYVGHDTSPEELEEYGRLIRVRAETRRAIDKWEERHTLQPKAVVENALKAVQGGESDAEVA
jgi:hypothetical protein